jgi:hypothetical protein
MNMPVAYSSNVRSNINNKKFVLSHREMVTTLRTPNNDLDFGLNFSTRINPLNSNLFPWLSTIASAFDQYRFTKLVFHYKPAVPTTTPGNLYLMVDPDVYDPSPVTPQALMNSRCAVEGSVFTPH